MNDEEIKKASECCVIGNCRRCPLDCVHNCRTQLREGMNNILNQQQLELVSKDVIIKEQQAEIERLKEFIAEIARSDRELKSETIRECVNKYTEMLIDEYHLRTDLQIANIKRLEQKVLTEMVGGENA